MSVTIPPITAIPNAATMKESEYNAAWNTLLNNLNPYALAANALAAGVEANALDAEAAVAALASAKWVSGSFTEGDVRWSPTDYFNYRCKNTGSRTIDPALDPTNWALQTKTGAGGSDTTSSAIDITLTSTSGRLQIISMSAAGKKLTLPSANTLQTGAPIFVFRNAGTYRFAVHKNGGSFLCYVNPGQVIALHCSDISTGAGVWHVGGKDVDQIYGGNTAEVLNAVSSTYIAVAMLSSTKAICAFRNGSTLYINAVVLNYGSPSGVPVAINSENSIDISIAAQTSAQATVVYKTSATQVTKGYVLDISGNTIIPGSVASIDTGTGGAGTSVTALSSTQLICAYQGASSGTPRVRVLDISASTITPSAEVAADSTAAGAVGLMIRNISASKVIVGFRNNSGNRIGLRLQSISGSTPAPTGSVLTISALGTTPPQAYGLVVMSSTRAVVVESVDLAYSNLMVSLLDISGTSPVLLSKKTVEIGAVNGIDITAEKLDANTIYATWTGCGSLGVDAATIKITGDDRIIVGAVAEKLEPNVGASTGYLGCDALDSTHVMQVARNSSGYLSAKTIEVAS